jgi:hypothetical protein
LTESCVAAALERKPVRLTRFIEFWDSRHREEEEGEEVEERSSDEHISG